MSAAMTIGVVVLAAWLVTLEVRRRAPRRALRVAATLLALAALLVIGLRPTRRVTVREGAAVLLTEGGDPRVARRLADSLRAPLLRLGADVPDLGTLARTRTSLGALHVVGWGPPADEWADVARGTAQAAAWRVVPHAAPVPDGITTIEWSREIPLGASLEVRGRLAARTAGRWVHLDAPDGTSDSSRTDSAGAFRLAVKPRAAGRFLYALRDAASADTIGVAVTPARPPRLLVLEGAPGFETGALKRWLAERGGTLALRTTVSRDRHRFEFLNRERIPLERIGADALDGVDLVVADARALAALAPSEREAIRRAVREHGLGVLLRADEEVLAGGAVPAPVRAFFVPARAERIAGLDERLVRPQWPSAGPAVTAARSAVAAEPFLLQPGFGATALLREVQGGVLAVAAARGAGRVGMTVVAEPSRWLRAGEPEAFAAYWSRLITELARPDSARWAVTTPATEPPTVGRPVALALAGGDSTAFAVIEAAALAPDTVALVGSPEGSGSRRTVYWPRAAGWQRVSGGGAETWLHVRPGDAWPAARAATRLAALAARAADTADAEAAVTAASARAPLPLAWVYLVFVGAAAVLWATSPSLRRA